MKTLKWLTLLFIPGLLSIPGCKPDNEPGQTQDEYIFAKKTTYRASLPDAKMLPTELDIIFEKGIIVFAPAKKLDQTATVINIDKSNIPAHGQYAEMQGQNAGAQGPHGPVPCIPERCPPQQLEISYNPGSRIIVANDRVNNLSYQYMLLAGFNSLQGDIPKSINAQLIPH